MVFCTYCGQAYKREEHLERHILTHTNVKPFKCFTCHMSFKRRDILQRHYAHHGIVHDQEPEQSMSGISTRLKTRTPIACSHCAKAKTKCDKKFPCSRCAARNSLCSLRPSSRGRKFQRAIEPNGSTRATSDILAKISPSNSPEVAPHHDADVGPGFTDAESMTLMDLDGIDESMDESRAVDLGSLEYSPSVPKRSLPTSPISISSGVFLPTSYKHNPAVDAVEDEHEGVTLSSQHLEDAVLPASSILDGTVQSDMLLGWHSGAKNDSGSTHSTSSSGTPTTSSHLHESHFGIIRPNDEGFITPHELQKASLVQIEPLSDHNSTNSSPADEDDYSYGFDHTQFSDFQPKTPKENLLCLERSLLNYTGWYAWSSDYTFISNDGSLVIEPMHEYTRDRLVALTQKLFYQTLATLEGSSVGDSPSLLAVARSQYISLICLPPAHVLNYSIRAYATSFGFFSATPQGTLDVNVLLLTSAEEPASLLILMMIAIGAANEPSLECTWLAVGLKEICRVYLFNSVLANPCMGMDPTLARLALIFTIQAGLNGDMEQSLGLAKP